ncbi:MAG: AAA family ATPase [Oscillospiraceae bacterium]|nr:AAA family ATPase [Oscillospiraceae bacterium]
MNVNSFVTFRDKLVTNCSKAIVGKDEIIEQLVVSLISGGHVLLEDVPGTGKTMLLRAFAKSVGGEFRRIQFTPDIMPADLTGINFYNQKTGEFEFRPGPLFGQIILADEINRATPRSQSALLEVMEEKQISVDGATYAMKNPYMVMATQNPVENYGTFPLPEAQMDRFFMRLSLGYMTREQEISVMRREDTRAIIDSLNCVISLDELFSLREAYIDVRVSDDVASYMMDIVDYTRASEALSCGVSTRGAVALYRASQIFAAMQGRDYVIPEDVKRETVYVLPHRLTIISGRHTDPVRFVKNMLDEVPVPLENK